jgi:hypothetical protein
LPQEPQESRKTKTFHQENSQVTRKDPKYAEAILKIIQKIKIAKTKEGTQGFQGSFRKVAGEPRESQKDPQENSKRIQKSTRKATQSPRKPSGTPKSPGVQPQISQYLQSLNNPSCFFRPPMSIAKFIRQFLICFNILRVLKSTLVTWLPKACEFLPGQQDLRTPRTFTNNPLALFWPAMTIQNFLSINITVYFLLFCYWGQLLR